MKQHKLKYCCRRKLKRKWGADNIQRDKALDFSESLKDINPQIQKVIKPQEE